MMSRGDRTPTIIDATLGKFVRLIQRLLLNDNRRFVPSIGYMFSDRVSVLDIVQEDSIRKSAKFILENAADAMMFFEREPFWNYVGDYAFRNFKYESRVDKYAYFEFGVWKGRSINHFSSRFPQLKFVGFDSFLGLSEDWTGTELAKGAFSVDGNLPKVNKNVLLVPGWIEETLSIFVEKNRNEIQLSLCHFDFDTYTPTAFALQQLKDFVATGTILIFDEFIGYPNYQEHEFKAFFEFCNHNGLTYRVLAYTNTCVAMEIK